MPGGLKLLRRAVWSRLASAPVAWTTRGVTLGALAVLAGALGEALLFRPTWRLAGAGVLAVAMVLAAVAWSGVRDPPLLLPTTDAPSEQPRGRRALAWRLTGIAGALLLAWSGFLAWLADPEAIFGLQGLLWLASMALLLAACARWYPAPSREADLGPAWTRAEAALFAGLIGLALVTYLAGLDAIPWRYHGDEFNAYAEAMRFYQGPPISLFTTTWRGTSMPSLLFTIPAGLMHLAGTGLGGVRSGVALLGALTVIPAYGLARLAWGRLAAALAGFAVATTAVAVHYSRISIIDSTTPFCWSICFYFLLRGLRSRRPGDYVWAGLAAGLSMYTFYSTRLLPYLLLAFAGYLALVHYRAFRERLGLLALVPVGFVVGFGPLSAYFWRYPEMWAGRGLSELNVPAAIPANWAGWVADWQILAPLAWANFLSLSVIPSNDRDYWAPFLLPAQALLLLLGAGILIARWRQPAAFLLLLWASSTIFVGGTLIAQGRIPAFVHWLPAFPALFVALALPPALWLQALRQAARRWWPAGAAAVAAAMLAIAVANGYTYLVTYPPAVPPSYDAAQGRFLEAQTASERVRFVGLSGHPLVPGNVEMMAPVVPASDFLNPSRTLPVAGDPAHDLVFVFYDEELQYLPLVQSYYPGGRLGAIEAPGGAHIASTYQVSAGQASSRYGVLFGPADTAAGAERRTQVSAVGNLPADFSPSYPLTATWSGALFVPPGAPVRLSMPGAATATAWVQGVPVAFDTPLPVAPGWVPFSVQARLTASAAVHLLWQSGSGPPREIDSGHLWPQPLDQGLAVTLGGAAGGRRIDPFVGSSVGGERPVQSPRNTILTAQDPELLPLLPGGSTMARWSGELQAEGGVYTMELRTDARARLLIDQAPVLDLCHNLPVVGDYAGGSARTSLAPGWHSVELDLQATGIANGLEWTWTRPDGVREIVPPARLRHTVGDGTGAPIGWPAAPGRLTCP